MHKTIFKAIGVDVLKTKPIMSHGGSQAIVLTAAGNVKLGSGSGTSCIPAYKGGTVRALAVTSPERDPDWPGVPTTAELGYPTVTAHHWTGISGPPKMPLYIVDILDKAFQEMELHK